MGAPFVFDFSTINKHFRQFAQKIWVTIGSLQKHAKIDFLKILKIILDIGLFCVILLIR